MENNCIYQFFNNSTIAIIIAVLIGVWVAIFQYKKQKQIDRKDFQKREIINELILLQGKLQYSILILDRIVNTYNKDVKGGDNKAIAGFLSALEKYEIPRLSKTLNEDIPLIDKKIATLLSLYFSDQDGLKELHKNFESKLKKWLDFIISIPNDRFNFTQKSSDIPELDIKEIENSIKKIIDEINKV